jgi:hypothetical protein
MELVSDVIALLASILENPADDVARLVVVGTSSSVG